MGHVDERSRQPLDEFPQIEITILELLALERGSMTSGISSNGTEGGMIRDLRLDIRKQIGREVTYKKWKVEVTCGGWTE